VVKSVLPALLLSLSCLAGAGKQLPESLLAFIRHAETRHGEFGKRAAMGLIEPMPGPDRERLDAAFLIENLDLAMEARRAFPWAARVSG